MSDIQTVHGLWQKACALHLKGLDFCEKFTLEQMAESFNGCGPEWMSSRCRSVLDMIFGDFAPCFLLHDVQWAHSHGTDEFFRWSNECLRDNCLLVADALYPWWRPRRYVRRHQARLIYELCKDFGKVAYNEAYFASATMVKAPSK